MVVFAAVVITTAVGIAASIIGRREMPAKLADGPGRPDYCVLAMLEAAQRGDAASYLDCFAGRLRDKLQSGMQGKPAQEVGRELQMSESHLKSYVLTEWQFPQDDEAVAVMERIYSEHNERHRVRLRRIGREWKIVEMTRLEQFAPEIPYGTPVVPGLSDGGNGSAAETPDRK